MSMGGKFLVTLASASKLKQRGLPDTHNNRNLDIDKTSSHCFAEGEVWDRRKERKLNLLTKQMSNQGGFDEEAIWDSHLEKRKTNDFRIMGLWILYGVWLVSQCYVKSTKVDSCIY